MKQKNAHKGENEPLKNARTALSLMNEHNIEPTPINYAVWYHYAANDRKELKNEIDALLKKKSIQISDDVNIYLYNKYVIGEKFPDTQIESASQNTQSVLAEIMGVIEKFSGDTETYNQKIDDHVAKLSQKISDPALKEMATEIINRAVAIRDSGNELTAKLEESKKEVINLKNNLEKITSEANRDFLTGISNRKALEAQLEFLTTEAKQQGSSLCLLMIDIDHFKNFNDKFGHLVGDEVLRKVAKSLTDCVKGKDFVARYGGEEFAVLLPQTPLANGLIVAENIRKTVYETDLVRKDSKESIGTITFSVGVAQYRPTDSVAAFMSNADDALYRSKMAGRNRVTSESFDNKTN